MKKQSNSGMESRHSPDLGPCCPLSPPVEHEDELHTIVTKRSGMGKGELDR